MITPGAFSKTAIKVVVLLINFSYGLCCKNSLSAIIPLTLSQIESPGLFMKRNSSPFKWRHYAPDVILLCVRWYCRFQLSYRDIEEMMRERGLEVDHSTVFRWVQRYAPEINKRVRPHLKMSGASYRVDETYIKVGKTCKYLYRAVDKQGNTIEFMLSAKRDVSAAKRFFKKMMRAEHRRLPFSISVDKNAAYPVAFSTSQDERVVPKDCKLRRVKYLNNVVEQDHRFVKKKVRASQCFKRFHTAERTLEGIEAINMMRKGQVKRLAGTDAMKQARFVASLFQIAA
jgi:transposase-like protein